MSHVFAKSIIITALTTLTACSSGNNTDAGAQSLYDSINTAVSASQFPQALSMMQRLDSLYPKAFDLRRQALAMKPRVMEGLTLQQIQVADSQATELLGLTNTLGVLFDKIADPRQVGTYQVVKAIRNPRLTDQTAIEPRIDEDSQFFIVASHQMGRLGLQSLTLKAADGTTATTAVIPRCDERVIRTSAGEMAIFRGTEVDTLGALAARYPSQAMTLSFNGSRGSKGIRLSPKMVTAMGQTYTYADALHRITEGNLERERLERQLRIARNQMANAQ